MNQNDLNWYEGIGFPKPVILSANEKLHLVKRYYGMDFDILFISNTKDGNQEDYLSLWLLNDEYVVECKNFLNQQDIDIARYKGNVTYINIRFGNLDDIDYPVADSSMNLIISLGENICRFSAVGKNCTKLDFIAKTFIKDYTKR